MRIVLDTNVLLAGVFARGVCEALLDTCLASEKHVIILSEHILDEFARHATDKFGAPKAKVDRVLTVLRGNSEVVRPAKVPKDACRDPDDLPVLGTALAAEADCLVTGDRDLLTLRKFHAIPIVSPRHLYDHLFSS